MRLFLLAAAFSALLALAFPAWAATATLSSGGSCTYSSAQADSAGNVTYQCAGTTVPTPPPPVDPRQPTPAPPAAAGQLQPANTSASHEGSAGVVYSFALPRSPLGSGFLEIGRHTNTPTEMDVEITISRVPGDMGYYKRAEATMVSGRGAIVQPCGVTGGASQGPSIFWSASGSFYECRVDPNAQWYINWRYAAACGASCNVSYKHNEY